MVTQLSSEEIQVLLAGLDSGRPVEVTRFRYKNSQKIPRTTLMSVSELRDLVLSSHADGLTGGDLEVQLDADRILVGHHDGIYWIEDARKRADDDTNA